MGAGVPSVWLPGPDEAPAGVPVSGGAARGISVRYNAAADLLERNSDGERSRRPLYIEGDQVHSYAEVIDRARAFGGGLLAYGLTPGDRLLLVAGDSVAFACSFWGALRAGIIAIPLSPKVEPNVLAFALKDTEARAVVFDHSAEALMRGAQLDQTLPIAIDSSSVPRARSWRDVSEVTPWAVTTVAEDIAFGLYTSGSTGHPKLVLHSHANLRAAPEGQAKQVLRLDAEDRILSTARMFFSYGLGNSVYLPAAFGASVVINRRQAVPRVIQALIERHDPTVLFGIGSFYAAYAALPDAATCRLRVAVSGGEGVPARALETFNSRFPGVPLFESLGLTEALHHVTSTRPGMMVPSSVGGAVHGFEVEVRSRGGGVVPEGELGEVWVKCPTVFVGYWKRPDLTNEALVDGWLRTRDLGYLVSGCLHLRGRVDDLMKVSGMWVVPGEVEDVLCSHGDVREAAVVQAPDAADIPSIKAYVCAGRQGDEVLEELLRLCRSRLPHYKVPERIEFVGELPRTITGKLQRRSLRERSKVTEYLRSMSGQLSGDPHFELSERIDDWDSYLHMQLISALERRFAVGLNSDEVHALESVNELVNLVVSKVVVQ